MMMEPGAAFSNPSSGKIDQQRKILEVRTGVADPHRKNAYADPGKNLNADADSCLAELRRAKAF